MTAGDDRLTRIDRKTLAVSLQRFASIASPTGHERQAAEFIADQFREIGLATQLQEVEPDRANAIGVLRGIGEGPSLMFIGHLDTSFPHTGSALGGYLEKYPPAEIVNDEWVVGMGTYNMKQSIIAYVTAVKALIEADFKPKGDIVIAAVCGEIEKAPVAQYHTSDYRGYGTGAKYLVDHGIRTDMAIDGEPTDLTIRRFVFGNLWLQIRIAGQSVHSALRKDEVNAVEESMYLASVLSEWGKEYSKKNIYGSVSPPVSINAIEGGWPWRLSRNPSFCNLFVEIRLNPKQRPGEVTESVKKVVEGASRERKSLQAVVEPYLSVAGVELPANEPVVKAIANAHRKVMGADVRYTEDAIVQSDTVALMQAGIPCVLYGSGRTIKSAPSHAGEYIRIDDVVNQTSVYALAAKDIGSWANTKRD